MKKTIFAFAAVASVAAFATTVESANIFGVLKLPDTTTEEIVIAVPWQAVGGGNIKITDLILPNGLYDNTTAYLYDGAHYTAMKIANGEWVVETLDNTDQVKTTSNLEETASRGSALIIKRTKSGESYPDIYLSGQYLATAGTTNITANSITLIGPTTTETDVDLNNCTFNWGESKTAAADDKIILGIGTVYGFDPTYNNVGSWYKHGEPTTAIDPLTNEQTTYTPKVYEGVTIPRGQGAWYISKGGTPTITWPADSAN